MHNGSRQQPNYIPCNIGVGLGFEFRVQPSKTLAFPPLCQSGNHACSAPQPSTKQAVCACLGLMLPPSVGTSKNRTPHCRTPPLASCSSPGGSETDLQGEGHRHLVSMRSPSLGTTMEHGTGLPGSLSAQDLDMLSGPFAPVLTDELGHYLVQGGCLNNLGGNAATMLPLCCLTCWCVLQVTPLTGQTATAGGGQRHPSHSHPPYPSHSRSKSVLQTGPKPL